MKARLRSVTGVLCLVGAVSIGVWTLRPRPSVVPLPPPPAEVWGIQARSSVGSPSRLDLPQDSLPEHEVDPEHGAASPTPPGSASHESSAPPPSGPGPQSPPAGEEPAPFAEAGAIETWASLLATDGVRLDVAYAYINDAARSDVTPQERAAAARLAGTDVAFAYLGGSGRERYPGRWGPEETPSMERVVVQAAGAGLRGSEVWVLVVVDGVERGSGRAVTGRVVMVPLTETEHGWRVASRRAAPGGGGEGKRGV